MRKFILFSLFVRCCISLVAQSEITLTFTCQTEEGGYVQPDSIVVKNLDRDWCDRILYPDTVYQLVVGTNVPENIGIDGTVTVLPNPFHGETTVRFAVEGKGDVLVEVVDLAGRTVATATAVPSQSGAYAFRLSLSRTGTYLLIVRQAGKTATAKLVNIGRGNSDIVDIQGFILDDKKANLPHNKGICSYPFQQGDKMSYTGYASGNASKEIVRHEFEDDTVRIVFGCPMLGDGLPCQDAPTVTDYDGNTYTTVKVGCQCWLKENLRTSHYADGTEIPIGDSVGSNTDPQYWDYPESHLALQERGYLYNWIAVMKSEPLLGMEDTLVQGVCPNGWHVPSVADWGRMFSYLNDHSEYLCNGWLGHHGKALASQTGWPYSYYICCVGHDTLANNATGFTIVSAGYCIGSAYDNAGAFFWTSDGLYIPGFTERGTAFHLSYNSAVLEDVNLGIWNGLSVRCLRDEDAPGL